MREMSTKLVSPRWRSWPWRFPPASRLRRYRQRRRGGAAAAAGPPAVAGPPARAAARPARGGTPGTGGAAAGDASPPETGARRQQLGLHAHAWPPRRRGGAHVALCAPVTYQSNPPVSGTHYQAWPVFRIYDKPVPWGFLVHGLEHGAVVIVYNCPEGCAEEVAEAKAMIATLPAKTGCTVPRGDPDPRPHLAPPGGRPPPGGAPCAPPASTRMPSREFAKLYMNMGPELIPGDCGAVDREATGWCPAPAAP